MKAYVKRLFGTHQQNTVHEPTNEYSAIVDEAYYHDLYKNEMPANMTAAEHFFTTGWKEGKDPCLFFQTKWYCEHYPDIEKTGVNPLLHYMQTGWKEERNPSPIFDTSWYLKQNPDVAESGMNPLLHFLQYGWKEGRLPSPEMKLFLQSSIRPSGQSVSQDWHCIIHTVKPFHITGDAVLILSVSNGGTAYYDHHTLLSRYTNQTVIYAVNQGESHTVYSTVYTHGDETEKNAYYDTHHFLQALSNLKFEKIIVDNIATWIYIDSILKFISQYKTGHSGTSVEMLFHDYFPICPVYTLLDQDDNFCGVRCDATACDQCVMGKGVNSINEEYRRGHYTMDAWRAMWRGFLDQSVDQATAFSQAEQEIILKAYPEISKKLAVQPHTISSFAAVRIAVIGHLPVHKGAKVIQALCSYCEEWHKDDIEIYLYGNNECKIHSPYLHERGTYKRNDLPALLHKDRIHIIFIASVCPETFCYTAGEAIAIGLPVACFDIGGQAEQVKKYEKGIILARQDPKYLYDIFAQFATSALQPQQSSSAPTDQASTTVIVQDRSSQEFLHFLFSHRSDKSHYIKESQDSITIHKDMPKLIAFYLSQFHDFPENVKWFGKGFSEWTNTSQTVPQFIGHNQPQVPIDVGYYNLSTTHVMRRQAELAKKYGIYGFCVYYYWFSGQKLMEQPMRRLLEDPSIDFPFFFFWANEDWTRLWGDGNDRETLYKSEIKEDDAEKFMHDILPYMKDQRYIRIKDKPALIIYKLTKSPKEQFLVFVDEIREIALREGLPGLHISGIIEEWMDVEKLDEYQREYHLDAITQFSSAFGRQFNETKTVFADPNCKSHVYDIHEYVANKRYLIQTKANLYAGLFTNWDNSPRRYDRGATILQNTPDDYKAWLKDLIVWTRENHRQDEQYIFINAWNEWAESAHVEPDTYYGYAYLQKTREALEETSKE